MRLEERVLAVDRRARPQTGHAGHRYVPGTVYADGKDALHRRTPPLDLQVRRRETQTAAQAISRDHAPGHRVRPAEPAAHLLEVRLRERVAHAAAAHTLSVHRHRRHHLDPETEP